jgi:hypothetical protein
MRQLLKWNIFPFYEAQLGILVYLFNLPSICTLMANKDIVTFLFGFWMSKILRDCNLLFLRISFHGSRTPENLHTLSVSF